MSAKKTIQNTSEFAVMISRPKQRLLSPPMYKVLLINDDFTPTDFVVAVLVKFFSMNPMKAVQITWQVHTQGKGMCGVYTREIAETKVAQVSEYARNKEYPLLCTLEIV